MTDIHAGSAVCGTRLRSAKEGLPPSRSSRRRVCASLFSLLVLLPIAAAYWYVTAGRAVYSNELYFDVGHAAHSTDVSAIAGDQHRMVGQILYWPNARQFPIRYRVREGRARADEADTETVERDCWRTLSNIEFAPGTRVLRWVSSDLH